MLPATCHSDGRKARTRSGVWHRLSTARALFVGGRNESKAHKVPEKPTSIFVTVGRCNLDPGLKPPRFQKFNLMKRNFTF